MGRSEKNYENLSQKSWCPSQNVKYKQDITAAVTCKTLPKSDPSIHATGGVTSSKELPVGVMHSTATEVRKFNRNRENDG
jgi:hypothetical protein